MKISVNQLKVAHDLSAHLLSDKHASTNSDHGPYGTPLQDQISEQQINACIVWFIVKNNYKKQYGAQNNGTLI